MADTTIISRPTSGDRTSGCTRGQFARGVDVARLAIGRADRKRQRTRRVRRPHGEFHLRDHRASPATGDILVRGGAFFPVVTKARLAGASLGGSFLKRHGIYVGFRLEFVSDQTPIVTTPVQTITVNHDRGAANH